MELLTQDVSKCEKILETTTSLVAEYQKVA